MQCAKCGLEVPADAIYCPHCTGDRKTTDAAVINGGVKGAAIGLAIGLALLAALVPLNELAAAISLGTLVAFAVVNVAVLVLRRQQPDLERPFRVPLGPVIPVVAIIINIVLILGMPGATWIAFTVWLIAGLLIYFLYSRHRSEARYSSLDQTSGPPA